MEKVACCPNCKSEDLVMSETDKGIAVCNNCENEFYTLEYLNKKYKRLELTFTVSAAISIIMLIIGVGLFILNSYMAESYKANSFIRVLESLGLDEAACFVFGMVFLGIALVFVYVLFLARGSMSKVAHSRHFIKKRGYKEVNTEE